MTNPLLNPERLSFLSQNITNNFYHLPKAILANIWYGFPARKLIVVGVTGTDGKTTTTNLIYKILKDAGKKVSMISTVNATIGDKTYDTGFHVTSPDPYTLQKFIRKSVVSGDKYLVLEVTSHALDQYRVWGIKFEVAVITNITHEHTDYHKSFENYFKTKCKLIENAKWAIVNENLKGNKVITFGIKKGDFNQGDFKLKLKLAGDYNIENALAALASADMLGLDIKKAQKSVESFQGLTGRMEEVKNSYGIKIFIDFAHTPNGLEQALKTLRSQTSKRLIAVFGAASERDTLKRPMMGEISSKLADITILTDEDPRYEDSNKIISEIAQGACQQKALDGVNLFKQSDRTKAIKLAVTLGKKGDIIGIFGKGHEKSMSIKGKEIPWSDREEVEKAIKGNWGN